MSPESMIGIGLTVLGISAPVTVAIMKLLPAKNGLINCPIREHESRMGDIEKDVAVLQENAAAVRAALLRIELKLDKWHASTE